MLDRDEVLTKLALAPRMAHEALFGHRHSVASPDFHFDVIDFLHADFDKGVLEGFRSSAKSTRAEEAMVIKALFKRFHNGLVVGASFPRAKERLIAIKNEFITNDFINYLFGKQQGETWMEGKIVLANGVCLQAVGAGASLRGIRHLDYRPDWVLIDDLEDEESVKDPEQRDKTLVWLMGVLLPALSEHPPAKVRLLGNRLDDDAVLVRVAKDPAWRHLRIPIMEQREDGTERYDLPPGRWAPMWPGMFPLDKIGKKRQEYERLGLLQTFNCEYMCEASNEEAKLFQRSHERTHAQVRTWEATYAAYDPARTVNSTSAATGVAVFSWIGNRLVVWRGAAHMWLPDAIIDDIFATDDKFKPVEIGVEATGLEEFIMQPLRHRALQRHQMLPVRRLVPPRGKDSFIRGLQPFFKSGEVEFVDVSDEARGQLLSFPSGRKDFPNALAYALLMRPGLPVYPEFSTLNIQEGLQKTRDSWYLATNATNQFTAGVLVQAVGGQVRVHADWIMEGPPGEVLDDLVGQARLYCGAEAKIRVPPAQPGAHDTVGLRVAVHELQLQCEAGSDILKGRAAVRAMLSQFKRGDPLLVFSPDARWSLNGMSGGFARGLDKRGMVSDEPRANAYSVLMEGLESFVGRYRGAERADTEEGVRYAFTETGRPYKTILPNVGAPPPTKDRWFESDDDVRTSATIMPRR